MLMAYATVFYIKGPFGRMKGADPAFFLNKTSCLYVPAEFWPI